MSVLRSIAVFLCAFMSLRLCRAQVFIPGPCPSDIQAMSDFDIVRYMGKWYEAEKYFAILEPVGKCITDIYTLKDNGKISFVNRQINTISGMKSEIVAEATQVSQSGEGKLSLRFPNMPGNISTPYWVIDTDYDSYTLVWGCYMLETEPAIDAWILTRERNPPMEVLQKAHDAAKDNNIPLIYFIATDQEDCPDDI